MKILAPAALIALAVACGPASVAREEPARQVVFVCEHGNVKSRMAATYFNQLAAQRGLPWRAVSRGSAPGSTTVPSAVAAALRADGVDATGLRPVKVAAADTAEAARIVTIGIELPAGLPVDEKRLERWNDVPPASTSYDAARTSLQAHVARLLETLSQRSAGGNPDRRN